MSEENLVTKGLAAVGNKINVFYQNNKPHIFTGIGIGGTILTGVLAAQSGARSARKIDKKEKELGRRMSFIEKGKLCWTDAIAPIAVGAVSCYSTFKVDRTLSAELAKRTTALIATEKAYEKLSNKTKEVLGEKKAKQIQDEVAKENVHEAIKSGTLSFDDFEKAPRVGNGQLQMFVDGFTNLPFWSNIDYLRLQEKELQAMMADLEPRDDNRDYYDKPVGIYYCEWLHRIGYGGGNKIGSSKEHKTFGWNKGFGEKSRVGSGDDIIAFYTSTEEWSPGVAVCIVNWETEPTDMTLGRLIKTSGLG